MSINGIGNDIIEIERVAHILDRYGAHFLDKLFTAKEQNYCLKYKDSIPHFAGRFAAKEAVVKAFGIGFGKQASWHDIEILNDAYGKPFVVLSEDLDLQFKSPKLLLSISHCKLYATAIAIWIDYTTEKY